MDTPDKMLKMSDRNIRNESITSQDEENDLPVTKRKSTNINIFELQKTRGKRVDYPQFNDPVDAVNRSPSSAGHLTR